MDLFQTGVVLTGAGLTSLTAAFYLKKKGIPFCILEKSDRTGGVIHTANEQGFIFETGPNTGIINNPSVVELFEDLSGSCTLEIANLNVKRRLIWKENAWHALPMGLLQAVRTPLFTTYDKFRVLAEPFRKKGSDPMESLSQLVIRRLGKSFLDYAVDPFISGVYAGDPNELVTKYALSKLYDLEQNYGSFIVGAINKKFEKKDEREKKVSREVFSVKGGLGNLIKALEKAIDRENIILNAQDVQINYENRRFQTKFKVKGRDCRISSEKLVTTVYGGGLKDILAFTGEHEILPLSRIKYAKVIQLIAGFKEWKGMELNAFGGLVPSIEKRDILGVLFTSSFLKERAPSDGALLSVFMGGIRNSEVLEYNDKEIINMAGKEIVNMLQLKKFNPDLLRIYRYPNAIPQYGLDSAERLQKIKQLEERFPGLFLAGNIRDGIGMADRIRQGRSIAESISNQWSLNQ